MNSDIQYIGEHLLPGIFGHFCVILGFVTILFSIVSYYNASKSELDNKGTWTKFGRWGFITHGLATFGIIAMLFYVMVNQMYEYSYAQAHVSEDLSMKYILSAFWEGQEGSFLLWMFWHIILGLVIIKKSGSWEAPVLMFVGIVEAILASMLLGIHIEIGDFIYKIGSNPTTLLRDVFAAPIFEKADYVSVISGTGLNPLLQNYWMTIHPPTLFLGFSSATIPFAYATAGFFTGRYKEWLDPALKWALFSGGILGTGILMGSAWAYEALSFGGYWAWDPVENMSFVPWLILVAGIHTNLIAKSTGRAIRSTYIYYTLTLILVLYSTYLTRSGILGDTSAHAFTEMGLEPQLIFLVGFTALVALYLYIVKSSIIPVFKKEESAYSREFWMFVGALVLFFSGAIIAASTSLPVMNAIVGIFDPEFTGTVIKDPIPHFNKFQIWTSVLVMVLSAKAIFLRYKTEYFSKNQKVSFAKTQLIHAAIAAALTGLLSLWINYYHWKYIVLGFCAFYTMTSNFAYLVTKAKMNLKMASSVFAHAGFGIMIIGVLTSGLNQSVVTTNPFVMKGLIKNKDLASSVKLIKQEPFFVNDYWITYESDTIEGKMRTFKIKFEKEDKERGNIDPFYVYPNILFSNDLTKVAASNPDAKHFLGKDIFTSIASLPQSQMDIKFAKEEEDSLKYVTYTLGIGDTIFTKENYGLIEGINFDPQHSDYLEHTNDIGMGVTINFKSLDGEYDEVIETAIGVRENMLYQYPEQINELGLKVRLNEKAFDNYFSTEDKLEYKVFHLQQGESFFYNEEEYILQGFDKEVQNKNYIPEPDDIAIQAIMIRKSDMVTLKPIYIIRDTKPSNIKDYDIKMGVHMRLMKIDPVNEKFSFMVAQDDRSNTDIVLDIAENVKRNDIIVLEAKMFPGINLFWSGACLMLLGFFMGLHYRRTEKKRS